MNIWIFGNVSVTQIYISHEYICLLWACGPMEVSVQFSSGECIKISLRQGVYALSWIIVISGNSDHFQLQKLQKEPLCPEYTFCLLCRISEVKRI